MENLLSLWASSGLAQIVGGQAVMMLVGFVLLYLAISRGFEPLLLVPIGFGTILANMPGTDFLEAGGLLYMIYHAGIETGLFPLLIFMGVGAMTDFGPFAGKPQNPFVRCSRSGRYFYHRDRCGGNELLWHS
jgi:oxaloacetate decarboxylase beta subunit